MLSFQNQVNAVGGLAILIVGGYFVSELTRSRETPTCSTRYPAATQMSFQKSNGAPMTPAEFQARVGLGEHGVVEKTVVRRGDGANALVLDVQVGGPPANDTGSGFFWSPAGLAKARSACLAYSVYVPYDFEFGAGGMLPGLYGDTRAPAAGGQSGFAARVTWGNSGIVGVDANLSDLATVEQGGQPLRYVSKGIELPKGRWVMVEQEVGLNSPNARDGTLRLWIDGRLGLEARDIAWRGNMSLQLSGVLADVGYLPTDRPLDKKPSTVSLSPLRLSVE
jgi:hypothetical protein